ncbi:hypothetical protein V5F32_01545 [Xanthobacter oligotrophicus]|uniref:Bro-N domain-containing protein n=1 Tax=Xanthobacter oligotrophicus TaxID=2607286 RepID=A0ABW6ZQU9_9HYPH
MSDLSLFNFNGHDLRVVVIDGDPWWVAADVCRVIGIINTGLQRADYRRDGGRRGPVLDRHPDPGDVELDRRRAALPGAPFRP